MVSTLAWTDTALVDEISRRSGTPLAACLQCHKCSSGCPTAAEMDLLPSQIIRLVQLGEEAEVLQSRAIWLCASCAACTARCPMGIDVAGVMDALRMRAVRRKVGLPDARSRKFNRSFLQSVRRNGRVFELGMMAVYKVLGGDLFADLGKLPRMLARVKIALLPRRSSVAQTRDVFRRADEEEKKR